MFDVALCIAVNLSYWPHAVQLWIGENLLYLLQLNCSLNYEMINFMECLNKSGNLGLISSPCYKKMPVWFTIYKHFVTKHWNFYWNYSRKTFTIRRIKFIEVNIHVAERKGKINALYECRVRNFSNRKTHLFCGQTFQTLTSNSISSSSSLHFKSDN